MPYTIRHAEEPDIPALCIIMKEINKDGISQEDMLKRFYLVQQSPIDQLFVCEMDGQIGGAYAFRIRENIEERSCFGEISVIATDPNFRRRGIGRFMLKHAERLASKLGCKSTWLVCDLEPEDHCLFYKEMGYHVNGYRMIKINGE